MWTALVQNRTRRLNTWRQWFTHYFIWLGDDTQYPDWETLDKWEICQTVRLYNASAPPINRVLISELARRFILCFIYIGKTTEYTQSGNGRFLANVLSLMMEKLAQAGGGGGCTSTPFPYIYHHVQSCSECSSWEGRYIHPISSLPLNVLCG